MISADTIYYAVWEQEAQSHELENATQLEAENRINGYDIPTLEEYGELESTEE